HGTEDGFVLGTERLEDLLRGVESRAVHFHARLDGAEDLTEERIAPAVPHDELAPRHVQDRRRAAQSPARCKGRLATERPRVREERLRDVTIGACDATRVAGYAEG